MAFVREPIPGVVYPSPEESAAFAEQGIFENITMPEAYARIAAQMPERAAVTDPDGTYTHGELDEMTTRLAAAFLAIGLRPLDRAIFQISNSRELVVSMLACLKAGIIPICTLTAHRSLEIGFLARHAGARAHFICTDDKFDFAGFAQEMRGEAPSLDYTIVARGDVPEGEGIFGLADLAARIGLAAADQALAAVERDPAQVAVFQLSGGTSGTPKIIPRFHNEYLYQITMAGKFHGLGHETISFSAAPMMHNAPIVCYWGPPLWAGGEVVTTPNPTPQAMAALIKTCRPNWMAIPLPLLMRLLEQEDLDPALMAQAVHVAPSYALQLKHRIGADAVTLYGMTEGIICYGHKDDGDYILGETVGRPIDPHTEIRIVDPETGEELPEGEIGEMIFRSANSTRGYFDAEDRNREAFTADGFCKSGDLMSIRRVDGVLHLTFNGRVKDVVSRGGEKINCQEVESVVMTHPDIAAVLCVPMPDQAYGEKMCAFVIPASGRSVPDVAALGRFLEGKGMAKFKWPERIEVVDAFPQTGSGKPSKPLLRDMITEILRREQPAA
ncbi:MAG: AMP-binding protein [Pseudodonghicola sp.]